VKDDTAPRETTEKSIRNEWHNGSYEWKLDALYNVRNEIGRDMKFDNLDMRRSFSETIWKEAGMIKTVNVTLFC
jgi:hypothetical protein